MLNPRKTNRIKSKKLIINIITCDLKTIEIKKRHEIRIDFL